MEDSIRVTQQEPRGLHIEQPGAVVGERAQQINRIDRGIDEAVSDRDEGARYPLLTIGGHDGSGSCPRSPSVNDSFRSTTAQATSLAVRPCAKADALSRKSASSGPTPSCAMIIPVA